MSAINVLFDVPDEYFDPQPFRLDGKEVIALAVKGWVEHNTPITYSARLSRDEILSCVVEDRVGGAISGELEAVFDSVTTAARHIDQYLSKVVDTHKVVALDSIGWVGDSCIVRLRALSEYPTCTPQTC